MDPKRKKTLLLTIVVALGLTASFIFWKDIRERPVMAAEPALPTFDESELALLQASIENPVPRAVIIESKIRRAAQEYGVDEQVAVTIAQCESRLDTYAANGTSSAKGVYQFTDTTWQYIRASGHQFDPDENIKQFMIWYPIRPEWWECE